MGLEPPQGEKGTMDYALSLKDPLESVVDHHCYPVHLLHDWKRGQLQGMRPQACWPTAKSEPLPWRRDCTVFSQEA